MSKKKSRSAPSRPRSVGNDPSFGGRRLNPAARNVLLGDLVMLCIVQLLWSNGIISELVSNLLTVVGIILLVLGVWLQFRGDGHKIGRRKR